MPGINRGLPANSRSDFRLITIVDRRISRKANSSSAVSVNHQSSLLFWRSWCLVLVLALIPYNRGVHHIVIVSWLALIGGGRNNDLIIVVCCLRSRGEAQLNDPVCRVYLSACRAARAIHWRPDPYSSLRQ